MTSAEKPLLVSSLSLASMMTLSPRLSWPPGWSGMPRSWTSLRRPRSERGGGAPAMAGGSSTAKMV
jgi:hypothetical protein